MHVSPKVCSITDKPINVIVNSQTLDTYCELHKMFFENSTHRVDSNRAELFESELTFSLTILVISETATQI